MSRRRSSGRTVVPRNQQPKVQQTVVEPHHMPARYRLPRSAPLGCKAVSALLSAAQLPIGGGNRVPVRAWAASWIGGLVPPSTVETAAQCPDGVARVETQISFLNALVAALTLSIFTPMNIKVTCADGGRTDRVDAVDIQVDPGATVEQRRQALNEAAQRSAEMGAAVFVSF